VDPETQKRMMAQLQKMLELEHEFFEQTDRGIAVIGGALVEPELTRFIVAHLIEPEEGRSLFDRGRPLEAFGSQITLAYAIGLISKNIRDDLDLVREIRNKFAHVIWWAEEAKRREKKKKYGKEEVSCLN
jgi:hypothetical protein